MATPDGPADRVEASKVTLMSSAGENLGIATVEPLSPAHAPELQTFDAQALETAMRFTLLEQPDEKRPGALVTLIYAAAQRARVARRNVLAMRASELTPKLAELLKPTAFPKAPGWVGARVDQVLHTTSEACAAADEPLLPELLTGEVLDHAKAFIARVFAKGFFRDVADGNLTFPQYVYTMEQMYQYVKLTTRILGLCVASSDASDVRKHFIDHLTGEINHEQIIERDLAHLGVDPAYVRDSMSANAATTQFALAELALISYYRDPMLLTAAPLAAEGISAHLSREWIGKLNKLIASWGFQQPERGSRFLSSHIEFDSGDDGHWEGSVDHLAEYLINEGRLRRFLSAFGACSDAIGRSFECSVEEMALFAPTAPTE